MPLALIEPLSVAVDDVVDITAAEKLVTIFSRRSIGRPVLLDLSQLRRVDIGAGYRLGNVLRRLAAPGPLTVVLSQQDYNESSLPQELFSILTLSALGPAISQYAQVIRSGSNDVTDHIKRYYKRTLDNSAQSAAYVADIHLGTVDVEDEARFGRFLADLLLQANINVAELDRNSLADLIAFCFEAVQNVVDHAAKKPLSSSESIFSYLAIRYHKSANLPGEGAFAGYARRVSREFSEGRKLSWLEIVVNDDGNGISGRQAQSHDIYWEAIQKEKDALREALDRSSVKLRAGDSRVRGGVTGEGFTRIRNTFRKLNAFASLRTGRCLTAFDGLSTRRDEFHFDPVIFGYMPGTAIQVVIPITNTDK